MKSKMKPRQLPVLNSTDELPKFHPAEIQKMRKEMESLWDEIMKFSECCSIWQSRRRVFEWVAEMKSLLERHSQLSEIIRRYEAGNARQDSTVDADGR